MGGRGLDKVVAMFIAMNYRRKHEKLKERPYFKLHSPEDKYVRKGGEGDGKKEKNSLSLCE